MIENTIEVINEIIISHETLSLATGINGLPSSTLVNYKHEKRKGIEQIYFNVSKSSIEYNQIVFNKNCGVFIGSKTNQLKIYGRAVPIDKLESMKVFQEYQETSFYATLEIEQVIIEKNGECITIESNSTKNNKNSLKNNVKTEFLFWFRITRAPFFTATIMPILLGFVLAYILSDSFSIGFAIITLIAGLSIHAGTNLINDYFDQRSDSQNKNFTPFNGGSRTIQLRLASQDKILGSALFGFLVGITLILLMILELQSPELLILLMVGSFLAYFYSAKPLKLAHHGLGEVSNFLGYGPILTISAWLIQVNDTYTLENMLMVCYWSIIPGLLLVLILLINEFQDYDSDKLAGKKTLLVRIGKNKGKLVYNSVSIANYIIIIIGILLYFNYSALVVISLVGLLLFYKASRLLAEKKDKIEELIPANALTVENHLLTTGLVILGFALTKLVV